MNALLGKPTFERHRSNTRRAGFTLIEVLVAFIVLAILTLTLQQGISTILLGTRSVEDRFTADLVARSLMTGPVTMQDFSDGTRRGELYGLNWSMTISPLDLGAPAPGGASEPRTKRWAPARIQIAVTQPGRSNPLSTVEVVRILASETQ